jgi:hypothetical protein
LYTPLTVSLHKGYSKPFIPAVNVIVTVGDVVSGGGGGEGAIHVLSITLQELAGPEVPHVYFS